MNFPWFLSSYRPTKNVFTFQASGAERNELFEARAVLVKILSNAVKGNPSVTPLKITTEREKFKKVNNFL